MSDNNQSQTLISIESLINNSQSRLSQLEDENRKLKDMANSILENNPDYVQLDKEAKKIIKSKSIAKQKVFSLTSAKDTIEKIKDHQFQIKELKNALSDYLSQYVNLSGSRQLETPDGNLMDIVYLAKLVKRK